MADSTLLDESWKFISEQYPPEDEYAICHWSFSAIDKTDINIIVMYFNI